MVEQSISFNLENFEKKSAELAQQGDKIDVILFCEFLEELIKLLRLFGSGMSIGYDGNLIQMLTITDI